jgi:monoamine oxidase
MPIDPWMQVFDCIVLGGGIAGVTAARDLGAAGRTVLLVEASQRIGGRMKTRRDWVRGVNDPAKWPLEAGAEYIHITKFSNRFAEFNAELNRHHFATEPYTKWESGGHNRVWFPGWDKPRNLIDTMTGDCDIWDMKDIISQVSEYSRPTDQGVGAFAASKNFKGRGIAMSRYALSAHTPGVLDAVRDDISVMGMKSDRIPEQLMQIAEWKILGRGGVLCGYDALPQAIRAQFLSPQGSFAKPGTELLGAAVTKVERTGGGVTVTIAGKPRPLRARSLICTFSVGVLDPAAAGDAIFGPILSQRKRDALSVVRMGAITKFSLQFKRRVWPDDSMTCLSNPTGKARTFFSAFPGAGSTGPFVLTGLLMGTDHEAIAGMNDSAAWRHVLAELERIFRPAGSPAWKPEDVLAGMGSGASFVPNFLRTDWAADPLFRGGNSYIRYSAASPVRPDEARRILRDPTDTLPIFWAGEATAPAYRDRYQPLAVHGAYISGVGAATDAEDYLRTNVPVTLAAPVAVTTMTTMTTATPGLEAMTLAPATTPGPRAGKKKSSKKVGKKVSAKKKPVFKPALVKPAKTAAPREVKVSIAGEELEDLRRYALLRHRGNMNAAAEDLLRTFLRTQVGPRMSLSEAPAAVATAAPRRPRPRR